MSVVLAARNAVQPGGGGPTVPPLPTGPFQPRYSIDLLGVNGDVIRLTDGVDGLVELADPPAYGFWMGPYESEVERTPGVDGARYGDVTAAPRPVGVSVRFDVPTVDMRRALADRMARALNPKRGLAGFLFTEADGTARMVTGRYTGGEQRWRVARQRGSWSIDLLAADDPYWQDAPGSELPARTWTVPEQLSLYPYFPERVVEDSAIGEPVDIDNDGHEEIYPDWLLLGPATEALLANDTTGEQQLWRGQLAAGKWIAWMTRPGMQRVVDSDGVSRFHELEQDPEPAFWQLDPGVNRIRTVLEGFEAGSTKVTLLGLARRWSIAG